MIHGVEATFGSLFHPIVVHLNADNFFIDLVMNSFYDYPIAVGVVRFLRGGILYSPADYEPIKDWLAQLGLLMKVADPVTFDADFDRDLVRFFSNDNRAQVVYALIRTLPAGVLNSATDEDLTLIAEVLLIQRTYRRDCCNTLEQVLEATKSFEYRLREEHQQLVQAWRLELASIQTLLDDWQDRLPILQETEQALLFNELPQRFCVDDAVFLYKEGISDWLMTHPLFDRLVGAELEHLNQVPLSVRSIVGRLVRLCQAMDDDGSEAHSVLLRRIDDRLKTEGINLTEGELAFCARPIAYRLAFKALRSGDRKLNDVDGSLWDDLLVDVSLRADWNQIKELKKPWLTQLRCEHAIALGDVHLLQFIPLEFQTVDMLYVALKEDEELIRYANPELMTLELAYDVVAAKGLLLRYIPKKFITEGVVKEALTQNVAAWPFVPEAQRTELVSQVAVEIDPNCLSQVPEACRTHRVCLSAIKQEPKVARFVPQQVWNDPAFQKEALELRTDWNSYR